jgi:methylated-DNA-[protein]-cysteine S-methyltransferase
MNTRHAVMPTQLGEITLLAQGDALVGLYFPHHWYRPSQAAFGARVRLSADPVLREAAAQLDQYLGGDRRAFDLRTGTRGDAFQERVWALLKEIPFGETTTYGALADALGDRTLAKSVGEVVGRNRLSVVIPCHRVVGTDGRLTGYAGGLWRKRFLLELEEPALVKAGRLV